MENSKEMQRFSEIISKHLSGENLTTDEKNELEIIARNNNFIVEQKESIFEGKSVKTYCYWMCRGSNWACNPAQPFPGCECIQVCI